jgi:CBS domain containing-hemolysin-like protein
MGISDNILDVIKTLRSGHLLSDSRDKITELIDETVDLDSQESLLIRNMMGLRDITATDIMVPRADINSVDINDGTGAIVDGIINANHTRIPVTNGSLDDVVGILHVKDVGRLIKEQKNQDDIDLTSMLRQPIYISPTMRTMDILQEMRLKRLHLALVVDEYGGTDGLITIEDLVEEIVGEINEEHDDAAPVFDLHDDGTATAEARLEIAVLESLTGPVLTDEDRDEIETLGGLVVSLAGHVPSRGEIIRHESGLEFEVLDSNLRRVFLLKIYGLNKPKAGFQSVKSLDQSN